jgi:hypothetical protein
MNENEDLISRLRAFGRRPVSPDVAGTHLAAMDEAVNATGARAGAHRMKIVAAFVVGLMAGTSGLATAGALPDGAQEVAHRTFGAVGIKVPHGDRYWGQECAGEAKKNHGQYVRSQPKDKRAEAAASRCGKPVQAGDDDRTGGGDGTGAGCQGPPPWAGKGKPDAAAKAARKQACGQGSDEKGGDEKGSGAPGPSTQAEPTTEPTVETTTTTVAPSTATTETKETTGTTTTTAPPATTTTTAGPDSVPAPSLPVEPSAADQAS